MVHVIQTNPESPSLLSAKAICHLGDPNATFALHAVPGLLTAQSHPGSGQPGTQSLYSSNLFNLIPNLSDHMLRPEAWLGPAHFSPAAAAAAAAAAATTAAYNSATSTYRHEGNNTNNNSNNAEKFATDPSQCTQTQKNDPVSTTVSSVNEDEKNLSDSYHIFVGDLAPDVEDDVLHAAFAAFGNVTECKIIKDMHTQKPKGYGFVAYKNKHEAERAIQIMNGQVIGSRAIRTNWAVRRDPADQAKDHRPLNYIEVFNASSASNTTIYVGGINTGLTESLLHNAFEEFGEIKEVRIFRDKGFSFIRFDTHAAATRAIVTMHGRLVGNQSCKCSWGKEPTHSNRLHSMNSNVSKAGSMLIPTSFGDESSRSTLLSGPLNVTPTIASSLSNLSVFPGWPANFSAASSVPFGTKLDCLPQLNMYGNVLDGLSTASAMDTSLPLRTLTSDPYKLNTMDLASDVAKNQYWSAGAKELESCLTSMVMTANNALSLPQTDSSKMDLVKSTANGTGASNLPLQEKFPGEQASAGSAFLSSTSSLDRLGALHSVHSIHSNGQPNIPLSCDLATPLVTDASSLPLHGLQPMTPGLVALKSVHNKNVLPSYPLLSGVTPYVPNGAVPLSLPTTATKLNLCDGTLHTAFSLNSLDPVGFALRNQQLMPLPLSLTDWTTNAQSYGCGFIQPEIPRPALISNCNGVSLLC